MLKFLKKTLIIIFFVIKQINMEAILTVCEEEKEFHQNVKRNVKPI
jgi:hypothetical protein